MRMVLAMMLLPLVALGAPNPPALDGAWEGTLDVGAMKLRLVFHFKKDGAAWQAKLDSVDQGATIECSKVTLDGNHLVVEVARVGGKLDATLDGETAKGTWSQGPATMPLVVKKTAHPSEIARHRPQEPKRPLPYDEIEVTVDEPKTGVKLAGTFTKPRGPGRFPAVVLVTGSGPQDRDEALLGHKPFLVLSDALTRKGIAVLRCDDRGIGKSSGDFKKATTLDFVDDALAQVAYLKSRDDVDGKHIGILGHSEGGLIAPIAATRSKDVAFIVLLAGPGVVGEEILYLQGALIARASGKSEEEIRRGTDEQRKIFTIIKKETNDEAALKQIMALWQALPDDEKKKPENSEANARATAAAALTPWFRTFLTLDPQPYLKQVKVPVLALDGERDLQVPPKENLSAIEKALKGNRDVTTKLLPGLNHLFQRCSTGSPDEYAKIDETMSPTVLDTIADWIVARAKR